MSGSVMDIHVGSDVIPVETVSEEMPLPQYIMSKVNATGREDVEDPFYVIDLGRVLTLMDNWCAALPSVQPFYAVKCNEDPALLKTLALLGSGFDCASKNEIKSILDLGVSPDRIIYANPCKQASHIKYAAKKGVDLMTFDNELELKKVKAHFPTAKLVLRIRADDPHAICQLGVKFGCTIPVGRQLLATAKELGLNVVGVSFHVGSGCQTPSAYEMALQMSAEMFQFGSQLGYNFSLLDIGGGYPGDKGSDELFVRVTEAIKHGLEENFSKSRYPNLQVIAEPGRYFACSTHAIAVNVISKRVCTTEEQSGSLSFMYYVNDGVYGSFNCIMFDHVTPSPSLLKDHYPSSSLFPTSLWGPTCDGLDKICDTSMPELGLGDWIYFDNMGAYTLSASSSFNGFLKPKIYYYVTSHNKDRFRQLHNVTEHACVPAQESITVSAEAISGSVSDCSTPAAVELSGEDGSSVSLEPYIVHLDTASASIQGLVQVY